LDNKVFDITDARCNYEVYLIYSFNWNVQHCCKQHNSYFRACWRVRHGEGILPWIQPSEMKQACVIVRLKLPDSRLQYFVHSSESMNPPQRIYGGKGAALVNRCYNTYCYTFLIYWDLTHKYVNLKDWPRHSCRYKIFTALLVPVPLSSMKSHIWVSCFGLVLPFSRKQVACRHA